MKLYQVIGSSACAKFPAGQICCVLDADAPKPPAYPFINQLFKERGHKTNSTPETRAYLPSCLQIFSTTICVVAPASVPPHRCAASSSVKRCLGPHSKTRKRKKHILSHFFCNSRFIHKILGLAEYSLPKSPPVARLLLRRSGLWRESGRQQRKAAAARHPCQQQPDDRGQIKA